jgi:hypothetical protein
MLPPAVGFSQHYGFFTIFAITPFVLLLSGFALETFVATIRDVDAYCTTSSEQTRSWVSRLSETHVERLSLRRSGTLWIFVGVLVFFLLWCVYNIVATIDPRPTYKHDVFDALPHIYGFVAAKLYVVVAIAGVWAVAIFVCLHVTLSMVSLLRFLSRHDALRVNLFHRDNCGGTSNFGNVNLAITATYVCLLGVVVAMILTHHVTYAVVNAGLAGCIALTFAQSFGAVLSIHKVLRKNKIRCLDEIAAAINRKLYASPGQATSFPTDLLSYRTHVLSLHTYPYARGAIAAVNALRFLPVIAAATTLGNTYLH